MCHACSHSLETLTLTGLSASKEHLLVSYPNVPYVDQEWSCVVKESKSKVFDERLVLLLCLGGIWVE